MPTLPHSGGSSKPLMMFGTDATGILTSPSNQLVSEFLITVSYIWKGIWEFCARILIGIPFWQWGDKDLELQADFVEDGSLEDNVESFLSHDDTDPRDAVGRCMDVSKGAVNDFSWYANASILCWFDMQSHIPLISFSTIPLRQ